MGNFLQGNSEAFLRCRPIEWNALTLYPIQVSQYEEFKNAADGITLSQQTLPARYVSMRYLEALYAFDFDSIAAGAPSPGYFYRAVSFLALALRLMPCLDENGKMRYPVRLYTDSEDKRRLTAMEIRQESTLIRITPKDFNELRPLLAEQNGLQLPDQANNAELEEAERDIAAAQSASLDYDFEALLYSVAYQSGINPEEIWDWPIRKFMKMQDAIDRGIGYQLAYLAEAGGQVKFTQGNPRPSWKFDKKAGLTAALIPIAQFQKQMGSTVEMK